MQLVDVGIIRRGLPLVTDLSITLRPGEVLGIQGASGCGKTTLLRCIAGLSADYAGTINLATSRLVMVFQEPRLLPWRTRAQRSGTMA